jgi:transposase-like protein
MVGTKQTELTQADFYPTKQIETPRRQSRQEITDNLIRLIFQGRHNFSEIAKELGISRATAWRYWTRWKQTEEAQAVDWEWWNLYNQVRVVNPEKALECLTRIKYRMTTEKLEVQKTIKEIKLAWNVNTNTNDSVHTTPETANLSPQQ